MDSPDQATAPVRRNLEDMTVADLAPLEQLFGADIPEQWSEMATVLYVELLNRGLEPGRDPCAAALALQLTEAVTSELGGRTTYINKGHRVRLSRRDQEIYDAWNCRNLGELTKKYNLCDKRVRQILKKVQQARFVRDQPTLPGMAAEAAGGQAGGAA